MTFRKKQTSLIHCNVLSLQEGSGRKETNKTRIENLALYIDICIPSISINGKRGEGGSGKSKGQVNEVGGFICGYLIVHQANYHHIKPIYKTCRLYAGQEIKQNIKQIEL